MTSPPEPTTDATPPETALANRAAAATPARRALPGRLVYVVTILVALIWILLDQATKELALALIPSGGLGSGFVQLRLVFNENAAFGIPGFPGMFFLVTLVVLALIGRALPRTDRLWLAFAYGLVAGGAVGNLIDRVARPPGFPSGAVVDFVLVGFENLKWPAFNLADVGIVVGAALVALLMTIIDREERARAGAGEVRRSVRPEPAPPRARPVTAADED